MTDGAHLLHVQDVSVRFGGLNALSRVDLDVDGGHVTGLMGPNGAGKTTLFNVISGIQEPTTGKVVLGDHDISRWKTHRRARRGIARTFQRLEVFGSLSARENLLVAAELRRRGADGGQDAQSVTDEVLERVGLGEVADERVENLSTGMSRLVELGRALALRPRLLLLDEPSSGLSESESEEFGDLLLALAGEGLAILLVEHDVPLVMKVCERIHVLDFGEVIAVGTPSEIQNSERVQEAYLGTGATGDAA
ncbi:MAG: ATP-binding cassette domain-containing protein [Actinomycetota bacterium]|nr:ATP-binding cassette domain-containing protein [Acidimicrobiia bacterium]MDQ3148142.1 ATP-binding cassette domain-containing protein [Actinomycetota bacterium]